MFSFAFYYALTIAAVLALLFARSWQTVVLLALVELIWVCLCAVWGLLFIQFGDLFFLYWACVLLFFSAIELVISAVLFMALSSTFKTTGIFFK